MSGLFERARQAHAAERAARLAQEKAEERRSKEAVVARLMEMGATREEIEQDLIGSIMSRRCPGGDICHYWIDMPDSGRDLILCWSFERRGSSGRYRFADLVELGRALKAMDVSIAAR